MSSEVKLLDSDGENIAVRSFLMLYGNNCSVLIQEMREHLEASGFDGYWPELANSEMGSLTKSGAQAWLRHLFSIENKLESSN